MLSKKSIKIGLVSSLLIISTSAHAYESKYGFGEDSIDNNHFSHTQCDSTLESAKKQILDYSHNYKNTGKFGNSRLDAMLTSKDQNEQVAVRIIVNTNGLKLSRDLDNTGSCEQAQLFLYKLMNPNMVVE